MDKCEFLEDSLLKVGLVYTFKEGGGEEEACVSVWARGHMGLCAFVHCFIPRDQMSLVCVSSHFH